MSVKDVELRVYVHSTESEEKVMRAIENVVGSDILSTAEVRVENATGHYGNNIKIITIKVKNNNAEQLLNRILSKLGKADLLALSSTLEERVDKEGTLFFRLSKQDAFRGDLVLYEADDVIHVSIGFQGRRKKALTEYQEALKRAADKGADS
ncbi:MAG: hypothetical protein LRS48_01495 [Desulfurococcales archaeon]|nr:hypothetical protein [Desulfurococcales archaeon]